MLGKKAFRSVSKMLGLDPDCSLPELVEFINENFDAGVKLAELDLSGELVERELLGLGESAARVLGSGAAGSKFYTVAASMPGKPPMRAVILVG